MRARSITLIVAAAAILLGGAACDSEQDRGTAGEGMRAATPSPAQAEPAVDEEERARQLIDAHNRLLSGFEAGDVDAIAGLLDPGKRFLVFHPMVDDRIDDETELTEALTRMFDSMGESSWMESHGFPVLEGDVAWITYHFAVESAAMPEPLTGRATEIWRWSGDGWQLSHAHWSESPDGVG